MAKKNVSAKHAQTTLKPHNKAGAAPETPPAKSNAHNQYR